MAGKFEAIQGGKAVDEYEFTRDWFSWAPALWTGIAKVLPDTVGRPRQFLEIGSFEGRSTVWTVENMMRDGDSLMCIDTWEGGEEHGGENMGEVEKRFDRNVKRAKVKFPQRIVDKWKSKSLVALAAEIEGASSSYSFVYIDGSHTAPDVLTDAVLSWPLLKAGGIIVFDDYLWGDSRDILHRPKTAIDAFITIFGETAELIHIGYQLAIRKKVGARP